MFDCVSSWTRIAPEHVARNTGEVRAQNYMNSQLIKMESDHQRLLQRGIARSDANEAGERRFRRKLVRDSQRGSANRAARQLRPCHTRDSVLQGARDLGIPIRNPAFPEKCSTSRMKCSSLGQPQRLRRSARSTRSQRPGRGVARSGRSRRPSREIVYTRSCAAKGRPVQSGSRQSPVSRSSPWACRESLVFLV